MKTRHPLLLLVTLATVVGAGLLLSFTNSGYFVRTWWFAIHGDPMAQMEVGGCWFTGYGVPVDREKGLVWLEKSAQAGYDQAQGTLGKMLILGDGVPKNVQRGLTFLHAGANQGKPWISDEIGNAYRHGIGVNQDLVQAYKWYAVSRSTPGSCLNCEELTPLLSEEQLKLANRLANAWVLAKAEEGCDFAQYRVGMKYRYGEAGTESELHAYRCFLLAKAQGHHLAGVQCEHLERKLSSTDISRSTKFSQTWLPGMSLENPDLSTSIIAIPSTEGEEQDE